MVWVLLVGVKLAVLAVAILGGIAWRLRLPSALLPLLAGLLLFRWERDLALGTLGWGIVFLAAGFVSLVTGVAISWNLRLNSNASSLPEAEATADEPPGTDCQ